MRYRLRERLVEHAKTGRATIQVRLRVDELLRLVDLQERLPRNFQGYDLGEMLELAVRFAQRQVDQSRQRDPEVDRLELEPATSE